MSLPTLLLFSPSAELATGMTEWLQNDAQVQYEPRLETALQLAVEGQPQWMVLDLRNVTGGGHSEERWLERLRQRAPELPIGVMVSEHCPEPVERRLALDRLMRLPTLLDGEQLRLWMQRTEASLEAESTASDEVFGAVPRPSLSTDDRREAPRVFQSSPLVRAMPTVSTVSSAEAPRADRISVSSSRPLLPAASTGSPVVAPKSDEHPAGEQGVLTGISRQFETHSPALQQMLVDLEVAARHDVTILLIGETGAGKTYLSRLIHEISPRRHEPFLPVACGALPSDLIESELFGHTKGAFTSAHSDKEGKFIAARRGSLLLDEIDVLAPEQQVKLLRVIETGEFEPVGSNQTLRSQARLIVASNLELQPLVEQGRFRPDLYYRLNMLRFVLPPLRQRKVDIVPLARKFVRQFALKHGVRIDHIAPAVFDHLLDYPWPGNVRELEHVVQRAVIFCRAGELLPEHLPPHVLNCEAGPTNDPSVVLPGQAQLADRTLNRQIALTEREIIEQALFKNSFSRTRTARDLGISRVTLYNKMKRYGLSK